MGENTRLEDITLNLQSLQHHDLIGVQYSGTSSQTAKLRTTVITVDNSLAGPTGTSNVYGVLFSGVDSLNPAAFSFNAIKGSTINVKSDGNGNKRGILVNNSNIVTTRDTNIYIAGAWSPNGFTGSYVGVETADSGGVGSIQLRSTTIGATKPIGFQTYSSSDILQTYPATIVNPTYLASAGIQIGPGTDLVTKSAGGKGFSTFIYPTTLFYCALRNIGSQRTGYLWPGTVLFSSSYPDTTTPAARYRVQQPLILSGLSASCNILTGGDTVTITVCKNAATGTALSNATPFTVTLTSGATTASFYGASVDFAAGNFINLHIDASGNSLHDLAIQLDLF
jgi:hypothetical protein